MFFSYDEKSTQSEYYEILSNLMEHWENEIVEFKEAKGQYSSDKIGQYFSAISNEANLKNQQYGWFVLGVSEESKKHIVGTSFKMGDADLLQKLKLEISNNTTDGISFLDIIELFPVVEGDQKRVLMFQIPAATVGMPTAWNNRYYARTGQSLISLQQYKIDQIRMQERRDWSKQFVAGSTIAHLDHSAIKLAREKYIEKMNRTHIAEEITTLSDEQFLTKVKLIIDGKVTNAAMLLLGNADYDYLMQSPPEIMWRLFGSNGEIRDYEIIKIPFLNVADKLFAKIRNLVYRYMPNQISLFPKETQQYDMWLLRELLNNSLAHTNYQLGGRIYINEYDDKIEIVNPGDFIPQSIEAVLKTSYNPPFYRNQLLAESMVNFHMIDTATSGIKKVFRIQRNKFFPMPDYDLSNVNQVSVTVYGKTLDERFTFILFNNQELDLDTVFLLDLVQKGRGNQLTNDAIKMLRKYKLVEGRKESLYLSSSVSKGIDDQAQYIKNKGFNDQYYQDLVIEYIRKYGSATKENVRKLLADKLPDSLNNSQKEAKIHNILSSLKRKDIICPNSSNKQKSAWILVNDKSSN